MGYLVHANIFRLSITTYWEMVYYLCWNFYKYVINTDIKIIEFIKDYLMDYTILPKRFVFFSRLRFIKMYDRLYLFIYFYQKFNLVHPVRRINYSLKGGRKYYKAIKGFIYDTYLFRRKNVKMIDSKLIKSFTKNYFFKFKFLLKPPKIPKYIWRTKFINGKKKRLKLKNNKRKVSPWKLLLKISLKKFNNKYKKKKISFLNFISHKLLLLKIRLKKKKIKKWNFKKILKRLLFIKFFKKYNIFHKLKFFNLANNANNWKWNPVNIRFDFRRVDWSIFKKFYKHFNIKLIFIFQIFLHLFVSIFNNKIEIQLFIKKYLALLAATSFKIHIFCLHSSVVSAYMVTDFVILRLLQRYRLYEVMIAILNFLSRNVTKITNYLCGYKILVTGRLTRRDRSLYNWRKSGYLSLNTVYALIDFGIKNIGLKYSICTVKTWLQFNVFNY